MAYPYYAPFYRPTYYEQGQNPNMGQFNQQYQQPVPAQPTTSAPQANTGLVWVQGEAGAKSYLVAPGNTVMLMDSEGKRFYLKSADASGMPMPLRIFEYKECLETASQAFGEPITANQPNFDNFVTREEFEQRMASMASQCQCKNHSKNNLTEVSENV
jgi:hypothetical protein